MMKSIDIISIEELSIEHCWSLFKRLGFFGRSREKCQQLDQIGRDIVSKCKGFPLAVKTMGSLLRFKRTRGEWESILLSYYNLPFMVKPCFPYCVLFPKDFNFEKEELIKLWMTQGYFGLDHNEEIGRIGEECFNSLAMHSFFQEFGKDDKSSVIRCKMHDIIHDLAQYLSKNECCKIEVKDLRERNIDALCEKANQLMLKVSEIEHFLSLFAISKSCEAS
ncbi:hypothetical protein LWI28_016976 [Acer negundo]|uniref:Disease resistance protein winged helix domain-containing protein n=1 Tax=Acer negundo TaxID=4023 RepID=A0AAD5NJR8_ACENE|nr:hypothetical protein LWI28_016976 [Acer negundo]